MLGYYRRLQQNLRANRAEILLQNWAQLRVMTFVYLAYLAALLLIVCPIDANPLQTRAVCAAIAAQCVFSLAVTLRRRPPAGLAEEYIWILGFGAMIQALTITLSTFAEPSDCGWMFGIFLILLTQIYTMPPLEKCVELPFYIAVFLLCSSLSKPPRLVWDDTVLALTSLGIALTAYFTLTWYKAESFADKAALRRMCEEDQMTGLLNKETFVERCCRQMERAAAPCMLAILDIDHFKCINDRRGHLEGDRAICLTAQLLQEEFGGVQGCLLGRFGGDEFLLFMPQADREVLMRHAALFLEKLQARGQQELDLELTASIGIASSAETQNFDALFCAADQQLYAAKGGKKICAAQDNPSPDRKKS